MWLWEKSEALLSQCAFGRHLEKQMYMNIDMSATNFLLSLIHVHLPACGNLGRWSVALPQTHSQTAIVRSCSGQDYGQAPADVFWPYQG